MSSSSRGRRDFLKAMSIGAASLALPSWAFAADAPKSRLNFVFFLIDDMGWRDAGCYGSTFYETPNIDRLAAQGMRFTDAYAACPVCSPTRASIMTGKYPARLKLTDYIPGARRGKLNPAAYVHHLPLEEVTIAEALKPAGYATCFIGKWHLGGQPYYPEHQGFDINIGGCELGHPPSYFAPYRHGNASLDLPGAKPNEYLTDRLTDEAVKFLDAAKDKPFFLYLSHYAVHTPLQAKKDLVEKYTEKAAELPPPSGPRFLPEHAREARQVQDQPVYAAMMQSVDESVGRVLRKLDELGLTDNTAIIFMSDNGGLSTSEGSPTSNVPLRGGKGWLYEGGIREPMIIKWPGVVKPGSTCSVPVISTDFYPTMLEMAGLPLRPQQHCDGVSLVSLLRQTGTLNRSALFWHYPHYGNQGGSPGGAVRAGDYKLIEFFEDNHVELYNLKNDIGEHHDLAAAMPDKANELRDLLHKWRQSVDANMPTPNPDWKPAAEQNFRSGAKDSEFAVLQHAAVDGGTLGYVVRTRPGEVGLALKKTAAPLVQSATFKLKLQTLAKDDTPQTFRNGFLAFGDDGDDSRLVKCGLFLGGRRLLAIISGPMNGGKETTLRLTADPTQVFEIEVHFDVATGKVSMTADCKAARAAGQRIEATLARPLPAVAYVGYCASNTTTAFSAVEISGK